MTLALAVAQMPEEPELEPRQRHADAVDRQLERRFVELVVPPEAELVGDERRQPAVDRAGAEVEDDARVLDAVEHGAESGSGRKPSCSTTGQ